MTASQIREVANTSSGTIAAAIGDNRYSEIDRFTRWLHDSGDFVAFGDNALIALRNAATFYRRNRNRYLILEAADVLYRKTVVVDGATSRSFVASCRPTVARS